MSGLCECGCGERTALARSSQRRKGMVRGEPYRFVHGHNGRVSVSEAKREAAKTMLRSRFEEAGVPYGFCCCGKCGQQTKVATATQLRNGYIAGEPVAFIRGHNRKLYGPLYEEDGAGCWVWQRALDAMGYGRLDRDGVHWLAHRWVYTEKRGPIPSGHQLHHVCRNKACVNPDHLEGMTIAEHTAHHHAMGDL